MTTNTVRRMIAANIAAEERWISHARGLIVDDSDCSAMEQDIARAEHQLHRMRSVLRHWGRDA